MKTIAPVTLKKSHSLLPNSSEIILQPFACKEGTLQVIWIESIDAHGLFFQYSDRDSAMLLATHHNGYSCHTLGERIVVGNLERIKDQADYIRECGGTATTVEKYFTPES